MLKLNGNEKILIVRLTALGDCLHTIPLAYALKKAFPNIFIGWAVSDKCKSVIENNPLVDKIHIIPKNDKKQYWQAIKEIRKEKYTISIDSQELLKSAIISLLSGAKHRLAHNKSRELSYLFANEKLKSIPIFDCSRHVIERNMDFARFLRIPNPEIDFILPENNLSDLTYISDLLKDIDATKPTIVISPSTTWITKFWPTENWATLIQELNEKANIILTGSNADTNYINEILTLTNNVNVINLSGKTNILQLKILFEHANIVVTPDSGSAHLAAATKSPTVIALFASTSATRNGAYGEKNINLTNSLTCQPCYKKICKHTGGIPVCAQIAPNRVLEKINLILNNER